MEEQKEVVASDEPSALGDIQAEVAVARKAFDVSKLILPGAILLAAVMISGSLLFVNADKLNLGGDKGGEPGEPELVDVSADDDPVLGNADAPVTIVEFSDYQCPFCRRFWKDTLPLLKSNYIETGKVRLVYRDYPLNFHAAAQVSAEATECADDQGKFWDMHDKIFAEQDARGTGTVEYSVTEIKKWARQIGLDGVAFDSCLDSHKYQAEVAKDTADGAAAGVSGTPSFFINGQLLVGAQPFSEFQRLIDIELK